MIKVLIADDQELIRESLKIILGAHDNIEIVGVVGNGYEVLETLKNLLPTSLVTHNVITSS